MRSITGSPLCSFTSDTTLPPGRFGITPNNINRQEFILSTGKYPHSDLYTGNLTGNKKYFCSLFCLHRTLCAIILACTSVLCEWREAKGLSGLWMKLNIKCGRDRSITGMLIYCRIFFERLYCVLTKTPN